MEEIDERDVLELNSLAADLDEEGDAAIVLATPIQPVEEDVPIPYWLNMELGEIYDALNPFSLPEKLRKQKWTKRVKGQLGSILKKLFEQLKTNGSLPSDYKVQFALKKQERLDQRQVFIKDNEIHFKRSLCRAFLICKYFYKLTSFYFYFYFFFSVSC